ncbi:hypothetical protein [Stakelama tenebrarum]|uniref:Uncharacterized protein n=1 Tax=Stakelama tenebrarum TaxID=2711215 RepID=A0A6G6Y053_9SPHN|nr:hypothetical protein [Sphingosinithalassobacter tenebrarum]QIG78324.1 hypothetical protein G5C33_05715 [Sphingosinithalassobacter tenebrarum]
MAKKKKSKKDKGPKPILPKEIAGIKVPKKLRKESGKIAEIARHPVVAEMMAVGIAAVVAGLRERKAEAPRAPETPEAPEAPEAKRSPKAPAAPKTPRAPRKPASGS